MAEVSEIFLHDLDNDCPGCDAILEAIGRAQDHKVITYITTWKEQVAVIAPAAVREAPPL